MTTLSTHITMMNAINYRLPEPGEEHQISACMWAAADLWELTDGIPEMEYGGHQ